MQIFSEALGAKAIGIDVVNYHNSEYPFCLFDGYELPFRDRALDIGILIHVLHHSDDAEKLLTECRRVIKDKIIIFEDMAACRVQNGFTTFHDFWGNKVKKVFSGIKRTAFFSFAFDSDDIQLPDLRSLVFPV